MDGEIAIGRARATSRVGELYAAHAPQAGRLAYLLTGDPDLAQDLAQEGFARLITRLRSLRNPDAVEAYLRRSVINLARKHWRRMGRERAYLRREGPAVTRRVIDQPDLSERDALWRGLDRLPVGLRLVGVASVLTAAALLWTLGVEIVRPPAGFEAQADTVRLVTYVNADDPSDGHHGAAAGDQPRSLHHFSTCMQTEGFRVPDPVRTEQGWTIPLTQRPEDSPDWREAAFVTCRPHDVHLTGDLILGEKTVAEIEMFAACMARAGYDLGPLERVGDEHRFDLRGTGFDTDSDAFHRAVFVTCAPRS